MTTIKNDEGVIRVQALIKARLSELEQNPEWQSIPPVLSNAIRHVIIRIAFGAYKIGLLLG